MKGPERTGGNGRIHKGNRVEGLRLQEELQRNFVRSIKTKITVLV